MQENEVVVLPTASFRATGAFNGDVIALGQRNIRSTAYKLQDWTGSAPSGKKASKACVMLELTEM
jgi:hypothetical protein